MLQCTRLISSQGLRRADAGAKKGAIRKGWPESREETPKEGCKAASNLAISHCKNMSAVRYGQLLFLQSC
jgi:hypothetical protein